MSRLPVYTASVMGLSLLATLWPAAAEMLIYDRQAIQVGEGWRLLSGHWVHFTHAHLITDLLVFGVSGYFIEQDHSGRTAWLYLAMSVAIGIALWVFDPALARFGGLSGLAYGNVAYLVLCTSLRTPGGRNIAMVLLGVLLLKLLFDVLHPTAPLLGIVTQPFITVPLSHLIGVLVAWSFFVTTSKESRHVAA